MKHYLVKGLFLFFILSLSVRSVFAFDEEYESHEHGHATLTLVQEKDELQLVFKSPAMNIVGFEHQASSSKQHAKIDSAKESLVDVSQLFRISPNAQCELEHTHIESSLLEEHDHADEHKDHDGSHESEDEHAHAGEDSHSEFEAEYHFECKNISALKEITVLLFDVFSSIEEIEVQIISNAGQQLLELDHKNMSIKL